MRDLGENSSNGVLTNGGVVMEAVDRALAAEQRLTWLYEEMYKGAAQWFAGLTVLAAVEPEAKAAPPRLHRRKLPDRPLVTFPHAWDKITPAQNAAWREGALRYLRRDSADRLAGVHHSTRGMIQRVLGRAVDEGWSAEQAARQIAQRSSVLTPARAATITRTELTTMANHGIIEGGRTISSATGQAMSKRWLSVLDTHTRQGQYDHVKPNGTTVPLDELFVVSGEELRFPGDSRGSGGNTINCRCSVSLECGGRSRRCRGATWAQVKAACPVVEGEAGTRETARDFGVLPRYGGEKFDEAERFYSDTFARPYLSGEVPLHVRQSMVAYKGADYTDINLALRGLDDATDAAIRHIANLDEAMAIGIDLTEDIVVHRGMNITGFTKFSGTSRGEVMDAIGTDISVLRDRLVGTIVQDKGFVSTSLNAGYVEDFGGVVFHIRVPKGKQRAFGFYDSAGPDTWEWEMLLDRNTQFRVVNMTADAKKGQLILDMELIP